MSGSTGYKDKLLKVSFWIFGISFIVTFISLMVDSVIRSIIINKDILSMSSNAVLVILIINFIFNLIGIGIFLVSLQGNNDKIVDSNDYVVLKKEDYDKIING